VHPIPIPLFCHRVKPPFETGDVTVVELLPVEEFSIDPELVAAVLLTVTETDEVDVVTPAAAAVGLEVLVAVPKKNPFTWTPYTLAPAAFVIVVVERAQPVCEAAEA